MLQHESQDQPTATPAAQIRVTSEELTEAINAMQASKDEAARRLAGTVPIGEVVKELNLEATPEEVWAQVQKQRLAAEQAAAAKQAAAEKAQAAEKAAADASHEAFHRATRGAGYAAAQAIAAAQAAAQAASVHAGAQGYTRPRRRRGKWWAFFGIGCAIYGITHGHLLNGHTLGGVASSHNIIRGDHRTLTSATAGESVEVLGGKDTLTLQGNCPTLTITGSGNHIRVEGTVGQVVAVGSSNTVAYTDGGKPSLLQVGDGNQVVPQNP